MQILITQPVIPTRVSFERGSGALSPGEATILLGQTGFKFFLIKQRGYFLSSRFIINFVDFSEDCSMERQDSTTPTRGGGIEERTSKSR